MVRRRGGATLLARAATALAAAAILVFVLFPFYWLLATSFASPTSIGQWPPALWPHPPTWVNYRQAFDDYGFAVYIRNSFVVSTAATVATVSLGALAGYGLARTPVRGRSATLVGALAISSFPAIAVISPLYLVMHVLGWLNSYQALIVPYTAFNLPFTLWITYSYFRQVPLEVEESALVDGASPVRVLLTVVAPLATPGLFTAGIFTFVACWTEFLMALSFDTENSMRTIPVGIALFGSQYVVPYGTIFAASAVVVVPVALLVLAFQRWVVSGLTAGAVKS
ncbi:MAG: carbohydrate ABC transporter permease [Firmicutes bacterium]|nr:carbohydrate ABC transporter permease [Bacillota bacterium]